MLFIHSFSMLIKGRNVPPYSGKYCWKSIKMVVLKPTENEVESFVNPYQLTTFCCDDQIFDFDPTQIRRDVTRNLFIATKFSVQVLVPPSL